jgi:hypothetical protein
MRARWLLGVVLLASCATVTSGGMEVNASAWEQTNHELRLRAGVELACPPEAVQLTLVKREGKYPTVVHAGGCGAQTLFSRKLRRSFFVRTDRNTVWRIEAHASPSQSALTKYPP